MTSFVLRKVFVLVVVLAVGLVTYNYFYGNEEEQAQSRGIVGQVRGLASSVTSLLQSEKEKYDQGKYDDAISKMKKSLVILREKAESLGSNGAVLLNEIDDLQQQEASLEAELESLQIQDGTIVDAESDLVTMPTGPAPGTSSSPSTSATKLQRAEEIRVLLMQLNEQAERLANELTTTSDRE